tara:strand:- start:4031 stop:4828 length:798 start_codon:yes stop_codon:yes gene_type:complete
MNYKKYILITLGILISLVLIDILTGIYFWNRLHLIFSSSTFNNIATPIVGIIAVIIYSLALNISFKQNRIIQSQHLKPYFENELIEIEKKLKSYKFDLKIVESKYDECNGINFTSVIMEQLTALTQDQDYKDDTTLLEKGEVFTRTYIMSRSYYNIVVFLASFTIGIDLKLSFNYIIEFADEIDNSKLLKVDIEQIKRKVRKDLIGQYISYIEFEKKDRKFIPLIPNIFDYQNIHDEKIEFTTISETLFSESYELLKTKYKKASA